MTEIKTERTTPKIVFENAILNDCNKFNTAKNLSAYFIGLIVMKMNIGTGLLSDCGKIHAHFQKDTNTIFLKEFKN